MSSFASPASAFEPAEREAPRVRALWGLEDRGDWSKTTRPGPDSTRARRWRGFELEHTSEASVRAADVRIDARWSQARTELGHGLGVQRGSQAVNGAHRSLFRGLRGERGGPRMPAQARTRALLFTSPPLYVPPADLTAEEGHRARDRSD
jgi:hypothetical protein